MSSYTAGGKTLRLGSQLGNPGGEGTAFRVSGRANLVAKIYHQPPPTTTVLKIEWMIQHPPAGAQASAHPPLAWPIDLIRDARTKAVVGYLMPLVDMTDATSLYTIIDPLFRKSFHRTDGKTFTWKNLHQIAANLSTIVAACHAEGYVVGDLNNKNTLIHRTGKVTLIDNDSFQVRTNNAVYRCPVIRADCAPPELIGIDLKQVDRSPYHDNHILAILVFMLLQQGRHPFLGECPAETDPPGPQDLVQRKWYPYDLTRSNAQVQPHRLMPPLARLHPEVVQLFQRCFTDGLTTPSQRPTAQEWVHALEQAAATVTWCKRGHEYIAASGKLCLTKGKNGVYCGSSAQTKLAQGIPVSKVDPLTGAGAVDPQTTTPVDVELRINTSTGEAIPAGTRVYLYASGTSMSAPIRSKTLGQGLSSGHTMRFEQLVPGEYQVHVRHAAGFPDLQQRIKVDPKSTSAHAIILNRSSASRNPGATAGSPPPRPPASPVPPPAQPAQPQNLYLVRVIAAGANGQPLQSNARVGLEIVKAGGGSVANGDTTVDQTGTAEWFTRLSPGRYVVKTDVSGRKPLTQQFDLGQSQLTLTLPIAPAATPAATGSPSSAGKMGRVVLVALLAILVLGATQVTTGYPTRWINEAPVELPAGTFAVPTNTPTPPTATSVARQVNTATDAAAQPAESATEETAPRAPIFMPAHRNGSGADQSNQPADTPHVASSGPTITTAINVEIPEDQIQVMIGNTGGRGAYVNRTPALNSPIRAYPDGTSLVLTGQFSVWTDGIEWIPVRTPDGDDGWIARYLTIPVE